MPMTKKPNLTQEAIDQIIGDILDESPVYNREHRLAKGVGEGDRNLMLDQTIWNMWSKAK